MIILYYFILKALTRICFVFRNCENCNRFQDRLRRTKTDLSEFKKEKQEDLLKYNQQRTKLQTDLEELEDICKKKQTYIDDLQDCNDKIYSKLVSLEEQVHDLTRENSQLKCAKEEQDEYTKKKKTVEQDKSLFKQRDHQSHHGYDIFKTQYAGYGDELNQRNREYGDTYQTTYDHSSHFIEHARSNITDENKIIEERDAMESALIKKEEELESLLLKYMSLEQENAELSARLYQTDQSLSDYQRQKKEELHQTKQDRDKCLLKIETLEQENRNLNSNLESVRKETEQIQKTVESMKSKIQYFEENSRKQEYIIDKKTQQIEELREKHELMSLERISSKHQNEELENKVNRLEKEIEALELKAKTTNSDRTVEILNLETKMQSITAELVEKRNTLRDVFQSISKLEDLKCKLVRENEVLKKETEMLKSKLLKLETIEEQRRKEHLPNMHKHNKEEEAERIYKDTLKQEVERLHTILERNGHELEAERHCNSKLQSKLQMHTTQLESEKENTNKMRIALETLEKRNAALIAEHKLLEFKANESEEQLKRDFSEAKLLEDNLKDDLKRIRAERGILQNKLADAEQKVSEYRRKEADMCSTIKDKSSDIDRLKHELEITRRELDDTNLRYGENYLCIFFTKLHFAC